MADFHKYKTELVTLILGRKGLINDTLYLTSQLFSGAQFQKDLLQILSLTQKSGLTFPEMEKFLTADLSSVNSE